MQHTMATSDSRNRNRKRAAKSRTTHTTSEARESTTSRGTQGLETNTQCPLQSAAGSISQRHAKKIKQLEEPMLPQGYARRTDWADSGKLSIPLRHASGCTGTVPLRQPRGSSPRPLPQGAREGRPCLG